jgi:DNA-binding GntR family transcriptional regulator
MQSENRIKTNSVQIANRLREDMMSHKLKPGSKLREVELSRTLGVSRSPIREALRILEAEGLTQIAPNKGAYVTKLGEKDLREIYELRTLLD